MSVWRQRQWLRRYKDIFTTEKYKRDIYSWVECLKQKQAKSNINHSVMVHSDIIVCYSFFSELKLEDK